MKSPDEILAQLGPFSPPIEPTPAKRNGNGHTIDDISSIGAAPSKSRSNAGPSVEPVSADGIKPAPIDWLWNGWRAKGKLQLLAGQPGTGKTIIEAVARYLGLKVAF